MKKWKNSYSDILAIVRKNREPLNLMVGNGFSIAFDNVFNILESNNLNRGEQLARMFSAKEALGLNVAEDIDDSKTLKLEVADKKRSQKVYNNIMFFEVSRKHPANINMMRLSEAESCCRFISTYLKTNGKIFSMNYDLLLHWAIVRFRETNEQLRFRIYDGFFKPDKTGSKLYWAPSKKQNLYLCHGSLELKKDGRKCYRNKDYMYSLDSSVSDFLDTENLPLIVSSNDSSVKREEIESNDYLISCFDAIKEMKGSLIIIGLSFRQNDEHIVEALRTAKENGLSIYYGCFSDKDYDESIKMSQSLAFDGFFDSSTANIWRGYTESRGKYNDLTDKLKRCNDKEIKFTFKDIEKIISDELPPSAYKYHAWWNNDPKHTQAIGWMNAGYNAKASLNDETVVFRKR